MASSTQGLGRMTDGMVRGPLAMMIRICLATSSMGIIHARGSLPTMMEGDMREKS